ncbi:MAG: hypothetical protein DRI23_01465 [Candidatus Cloacimonadota bacterium]|nr:MAG: hypothetical protein DRI23_01465 [Candidatus Cloacimonadota bacterium]
MTWLLMTGISIVALLIYLFYLQLFYRGIKNGTDLITYRKPFVSVIVAARNEERNIVRLLTVLVNQSYSNKLYEIIIANDGSTDKTEELINQFSQKWNNLHLVNVYGRENVTSPKKNALSQAIAKARGEIILTTDADCIMSKYWLESMLPNFEDADMVIGYSRTQITQWDQANSAQKFEHFDFAAMFLAAAGAIVNNRYFSCSGQNLAYRKSAFEYVGGFEKIKHLISGDDVNLMQLFRKANLTIRFAFNPHSFVFTHPIDNWQQLFNQRGRWASNMKWQLGLNPEFFIYLSSAFLIVIMPYILLFKYWWVALFIVVTRIIGEFRFLKIGFNKFAEEKNRLNFYLLWFILQPVYFIVVAFKGAIDQFSWKK